jgi:hypothetical protein
MGKATSLFLVTVALLLAERPCVAGEEGKRPPAVRLAIECDDGSHIVGTTKLEALKVTSVLVGKVEAPLKRIRRLEFSGDRETVKIVFANGDTLQGALDLPQFELETVFGSVSVPTSHVLVVRKPLIGGLVAYYPFNGNANDESANGNNGTVNGVTLAEDRFGRADRAYYFDGESGHVIDCGAGKSLQVGGPGKSFSTALWAKRAETMKMHFLIGMGISEFHHAVALGFNQTGTFAVNFCGNAVETPKAYPDVNEWHHWAVTYNGATKARRIYRDGVLVGQDKSPQDFLGQGSVYVGQPPWKEYPFHGTLDQVRIYSRALSEPEVQELYWTEKESDESLGEGSSKETPIPPRDPNVGTGESGSLLKR